MTTYSPTLSPESASTHTGGAIFETGAIMAGHKPVWGIEIRPDIARYAKKNIPDMFMIAADVATVDYSLLPKVYHLHSSPSCKNASQANADGEEAIEDISSATAICKALRALEPPCFTLENVWQYRDFDSFKLIVRCLRELAYCVDWWHLNSADYGVAQTRKRLILIARRDRQPHKPVPTHSDTPDMFGIYKPWVGWYEAIQDLIPTLPESEFAPWQMERLPEELKISFYTDLQNATRDYTTREKNEPATTVVSTMMRRPSTTPMAVLAPAHRAFITSDNYGAPNTVEGERKLQIYGANEPAMTVRGRAKTTMKAFAGKVIKMTPRALARLQSVPDSYLLPDANGLACEILGNGVPTLLAKAICEAIQ